MTPEEAVDTTLLRVDDLHLSFGGVHALSGVSFEVKRGEILAIIGPNGAGKTCVLNCISRFYDPQKGEIYFEGKPITHLSAHAVAKLGIARSFQNIELFNGLTALDNLMAARHMYFKHNFLEGALFFGRARKEEVEQRRVVEELIDFLNLAPLRKMVVGTLSYGQRKRVELGRALALKPKLLLVDEPMTGLSGHAREDLARHILDINEERGTTIILIDHDMGVIMDISDRVVVLDFGRKITEGTPDEIKRNPDVIKAYLGTE